ncbi:MAG TPA: nicotinate-nucleotide adenylyltransferase [Anaerolineae bacterium]|nr:nicotinate-nucleotide adenylyltransferase [Anaerolineae bacterium]HQH37675.1 nicotinate-nucleotide adenylyltransferase [Anaerolineae bacterium]
MTQHTLPLTPHASRIGILGGSFDPPHYGHLALAETARVQLHLDGVLFVPAGEPPHKRNRPLSSAEDRAAMTAAAIADNPAFMLSRVDLDRPGPHYTVDMLTLLRAQYPDIDACFLLLGEDSLHDLPLWYNPQGILELAYLAVMPRLSQRVDLAELTAALPFVATKLVWLDVPLVNLAATDLRRRVSEGLPLRYLVPPSVEAYIHEHNLYQRSGE